MRPGDGLAVRVGVREAVGLGVCVGVRVNVGVSVAKGVRVGSKVAVSMPGVFASSHQCGKFHRLSGVAGDRVAGSCTETVGVTASAVGAVAGIVTAPSVLLESNTGTLGVAVWVSQPARKNRIAVNLKNSRHIDTNPVQKVLS